ncbi:MAG: hypothetical protein JWP27_960 [Flaviaesturariibacter sp.]|nr:hypothetical protein [Flaviaesturariibacter sp.]
MKKLFLFSFFAASLSAGHAQGLKGLMKKATEKDSSGKTPSASKIFEKVSGAAKGTSLSNEDIISGLKEALSVGTTNGTQKLSAADGFFKDAAIKILMPAEAQKAEQTLRNMGLGKQVDNAILSMNRAAEEAAKSAAPIFINAIRGITIQDGIGILKGSDNAATTYLQGRTTTSLTEAFRPSIEAALKKVDATKYWNTVFTTYNKFSKEKVNTDLTAYVTEKALAGIFYQVALEEGKIRKDPAARVTDILKKVFGN